MSETILEKIEHLRDKIHEDHCNLHIALNLLDQQIADLERMEREMPDPATREGCGLLRESIRLLRLKAKSDHSEATRGLNHAEAKLEGLS